MSESSDNINQGEKVVFKGVVRHPQSTDVSQLRTILETWVRDNATKELIPTEVASIVTAVEESVADKNAPASYLVAEEEGKVLGMIGYKKPENKMRALALTDNPTELINAFVDADNRAGRGVGRALTTALEKEVQAKGYKEIMVNSGPRYRETAWDFYNRVYGPSIGVLKDYYGEGVDAPVWRKILNS